MSGRTFAVTFSAVAVSAAQDLFELTPGLAVEIVGIELGQSSDAADAQDELLQISIIRGHATSGSGGSSATPVPMSPGDSAGFGAEVNNTTVASAGTAVVLHTGCWNVRAGYINWFPEGCRPRAGAAQTSLVVRQTAPADAITMSGTLYVRELV